ncbi:hypothetical protein [Chamaesiphon sp. VAR_48_metabat_403]|uniref:hypothetical protein n=1 Tax=Chamaesiphon sp. VAR_48_metabat_403 TaxID=2964700 RepID=UPI00286E462B|nr:hypothetical protein [Chamaesiphon sp. VAR_48_metabat_403]
MLMPDLSPLWISLKVSLLATFFTFGLETSVAYRMYYYRGRARSLIEAVLIAPLILPPTVVGFSLLVLLGKNGAIEEGWFWTIIVVCFALVGLTIVNAWKV